MLKRFLLPLLALSTLLAFPPARADLPWVYSDNTRYLVMGDSLSAGYGAMPMTEGYAYLLYKRGVYDSVPDTVFANAAIPGATSALVLAHQVPLATAGIYPPHVITMTVGGNDLFTIFDHGANPSTVLFNFQGNLASILLQLCVALPDTRIYVGNLYTVKAFPEVVATLVQYFNQTIDGVTAFANASGCGGRVKVADLHAAFSGQQEGLLLTYRQGAAVDQAHPSNAGHRAIAEAFIAAAK